MSKLDRPCFQCGRVLPFNVKNWHRERAFDDTKLRVDMCRDCTNDKQRVYNHTPNGQAAFKRHREKEKAIAERLKTMKLEAIRVKKDKTESSKILIGATL